MPSTKQGGGYTLTFSKKNKDIEKLLAKKKEQGIQRTDYICDAIRAYENNSNLELNINTIHIDIERMVQEQVALAVGKTNGNINRNLSLESNLDDVNTDDD